MQLMLRDSSQTDKVPAWNDFRPTTTKTILAHYYGNSTGAISNALIQYVGTVAGLAAALVGADPVATKKVTTDFIKKYREQLQTAMNGNQRAKIDSPAEKARIVAVYSNYYTGPGNPWMNSFKSKTAQECLTAAATLRAGNLANATTGCGMGDTSACRWEGLINCQIQYLTFIAELKTALATTPPGTQPPPLSPPTNNNNLKAAAIIGAALTFL
jgi:hypothetical protein